MKLVITIELKRSRRKEAAESYVDATAPTFVPWYYVEQGDLDDDEEEDYPLDSCPAGVNVASAALNRTGLGSSPRRGTYTCQWDPNGRVPAL